MPKEHARQRQPRPTLAHYPPAIAPCFLCQPLQVRDSAQHCTSQFILGTVRTGDFTDKNAQHQLYSSSSACTVLNRDGCGYHDQSDATAPTRAVARAVARAVVAVTRGTGSATHWSPSWNRSERTGSPSAREATDHTHARTHQHTHKHVISTSAHARRCTHIISLIITTLTSTTLLMPRSSTSEFHIL